MTPKLVALTVDVDLVDYATGRVGDELGDNWPALAALLLAPDVAATWFLRLDAAVERDFGHAEWLFDAHADVLDRLRAAGHEIGWHHHAYVGDQPVRDPAALAREVRRWGERARARGLTAARMGWSFHTQETMAIVDALGFTLDSSAMPRPRYPWDVVPKDWEGTPLVPFHPAIDDYRVPGEPRRRVLQVPMTTVPLPAPTDTRRVLRNISPAYQPAAFATACEAAAGLPLVVPVLHPYEMHVTVGQHALFGGGVDGLRRNLDHLRAQGYRFATLSGAAAQGAAAASAPAT